MIRLHYRDLSHFLTVESQKLVSTELESLSGSNLGNVISSRCCQYGLLEFVVLLHFEDERLELIESHRNALQGCHFGAFGQFCHS